MNYDIINPINLLANEMDIDTQKRLTESNCFFAGDSQYFVTVVWKPHGILLPIHECQVSR